MSERASGSSAQGERAGGSSAQGERAGGSSAQRERAGDPPPPGAPGCGTHASLGTELRAVAVLALDRLGPLLERVRTEPGRPQSAAACAVCPICAVVALLRGERPELGVRLAEHASGLLTVLQAALHEGDPAAYPPPTHPPFPPPTGPARRVQHIRIERPVSC